MGREVSKMPLDNNITKLNQEIFTNVFTRKKKRQNFLIFKGCLMNQHLKLGLMKDSGGRLFQNLCLLFPWLRKLKRLREALFLCCHLPEACLREDSLQLLSPNSPGQCTSGFPHVFDRMSIYHCEETP